MRGQFQIYKTIAALQARLIPYNQEKYKDGAIYLEMAKSTSKSAKDRTYDWANKINFAIGMSDIFALYEMLGKGKPDVVKLFHQNDSKGKLLTLTPGTGNYEGTWMLNLKDMSKGTDVSVPMSGGEFRVFIDLIRASMPAIIGWDVTQVYNAIKDNE